jgi:hypothetical protein
LRGAQAFGDLAGLSFDHKLFKPNYRLNFNFHAGDRKFAYANERTRGSCSPKKFLANGIYLRPVRDVLRYTVTFSTLSNVAPAASRIDKYLTRLRGHVLATYEHGVLVYRSHARYKQ